MFKQIQTRVLRKFPSKQPAAIEEAFKEEMGRFDHWRTNNKL